MRIAHTVFTAGSLFNSSGPAFFIAPNARGAVRTPRTDTERIAIGGRGVTDAPQVRDIMAKAKVTLGEETHELELEKIGFPEGYRVLGPGEVPEGYVTKDSMTENIKDRLDRQKKSLKDDKDFVRSILESAGVPLSENGEITLPKPEEVDEEALRERIKSTIIREQVEPLKQQADNLNQEVQALRVERRNGSILEAARRAGVQEYLFDAPTEGAPAPIVNLVAPYLDYHEEKKSWFVKDGEHFAPSSKEGKPYADADDLFERLKKNEAWKTIFTDPRPGTSNYNAKGGSGKPSGKKKSDMTDRDKIAFINEHGRPAYDDLPD